ncbi:MAG TPA: threonylcarbamoyl-AMP synthase [Flavobacteriaceae bacterium]|nr:threonylcarbamoyl-AMP synthase [Flavobacteriaceae bacterium]
MVFHKEIDNTVSFLNKGKTILYPTDTVWGIGCDATDENAVKKIYTIKQRDQNKNLIILVDSFNMLQKYITKIPEEIKTFLAEQSKPTTVIYDNPTGLPKNIIADDNTIAIRIVKDIFCNTLIKTFGKPIVSTSANISTHKTPIKYSDINPNLISKVDFAVPLNIKINSKKPSKIIRFTNNQIIILRD